MHRFFVDRARIDRSQLITYIDGEDAVHISRVLRLRPGDALTLCDGCETEYTAVIKKADPGRVDLTLSEERLSISEPRCRITLYQCLPKTGKMETIIQKCVEIGVFAIVPVVSKRCVTRIEDRDVTARIERWQRVALEASKQSGRGRIPEVRLPENISRIDSGKHDLFLTADEEEKAFTLKNALKANGQSKDVGLLIGPEGGLERSEAENIPGAVRFTLGNRILRTETAGMAVTAMILYETEGQQ
jgi:16S rRNA (uracil1498-N3)-methyltransferase